MNDMLTVEFLLLILSGDMLALSALWLLALPFIAVGALTRRLIVGKKSVERFDSSENRTINSDSPRTSEGRN